MSGNLSVPNTFGSASGNVPASQLDANWAAVVNYVNPREITIGTVGARPAAGTAGRWYFATDVNGGTLYADTGTTWQTLTPGVTVPNGSSVITWHSGATTPIPAGSTEYVGFGQFSATRANVDLVTPISGTASSLYVTCNTSPGVGQSYTVTVFVAGGATALTTTISDAASTGSDLTHSFAITAFQTYALQVVTSAGALAPILTAAMIIQP